MIKRVNFTGRRRIGRECVDITLHASSPRTFDARIDLSATSMPGDGRLYLEAMSAGSSVVQRFDFGRVDNVIAPGDRSLSQIEGENVFFVLKVVDSTQKIGRILGLADNIRPLRADDRNDGGRYGILPVDMANLGQEVWRLDFDGPDPVLLVNSEVPELYERIRWDALLYSTVYPAAVRQILTEALDRGAGLDDEDDSWAKSWLVFARSLHPEHEAPPIKERDDEAWRDWINEVVGEFSSRHCLLDKFAKRLPLEGEEL